jgi:hypothetical protein
VSKLFQKSCQPRVARNGIRIRLFGAIRIITATICDYRDSLLAWNLPVVCAAIMPAIFLRSSLDILLLVFLAAAFLAIRTYQRRGRLPYPPGPRPLPLVGNLFDIPKEFSWLSYAQLSKKHGMVYFGGRATLTEKNGRRRLIFPRLR